MNKVLLIGALLIASCATTSDTLSGHGGTVSGVAAAQFVQITSSEPLEYTTGTRFSQELRRARRDRSSDPNRPGVEHDCQLGSRVLVQSAPTQTSNAELAASEICDAIERAKTRSWLNSEVNWEIILLVTDQAYGRWSMDFAPEAAGNRGLAFAVGNEKLDRTTEHSRLGSFLVHEAFHIDLAASSRGRRGEAFQDLPTAGRVFEETTAYLLGYCNTVLAGEPIFATEEPNGIFDRQLPTGRIETVSGPFKDEEVAGILDLLTQQEMQYLPPLPFYLGFQRTIFLEVSGGEEQVLPRTPQADRLVQICDRVAHDIDQTRLLLEEIASDGVDAPRLDNQ